MAIKKQSLGKEQTGSMIKANGCPAAVDIRGLWAGYNQLPALEDVTFQVGQREVVGIIGPNGSGKSTLMKSILGLVKPWQGNISVFGKPSGEQRKKVGYMPQIEEVEWDFPVTVGDVALMGRYARRGLLRRPTGEDREAADSALRRVEMYQHQHRLIGELSGGQRRRVLLARALANNPRLLLMDEPMAGLDATVQHRLLDIIDDLRAEGTTILLSTHDLSCVSTCAAKVVCLNRRLVAFGPPGEVLTETVLNQTFGTHLLLVHMDGQAYAYQHHTHPGASDDEIDDEVRIDR
jgi:manganese/iron transport system ATP-binding protein